MQEKITFQNSKGDNLVGILSDPVQGQSSSVVIWCHGFSSSKQSNKATRLERDLNEKGVATFRFDFYGHGESDGKFEDVTVSEAVDDAEKAIEFLKRQGYKSIGLGGASFGGTVSLVVASKDPALFALILIAPVSNWKDKIEQGFTNSYEGLENLEEKGHCYYLGGFWGKLKIRKLKLNKTFFDDAFQFDGYELAKDVKVPTLIIHGNRDKSVPVEQSEMTAKNISDSELMIIKGANHIFLNPAHFVRMIKRIVDFIVEHATIN